MTLFSPNLSAVETILFENLKKTKAAYPEETLRIEMGLALMRELTRVTKDAAMDFPNKPNLMANHNLFAINRQLSLNAYLSLLFASYGTQLVILRTTLENSTLMRLFNKNPKLAFEWLPKDVQEHFSEETQRKYGESGKHDREYHHSDVSGLVNSERIAFPPKRKYLTIVYQ